MIDEFKEKTILILDLISKIDGFKANTPGGCVLCIPRYLSLFWKNNQRQAYK